MLPQANTLYGNDGMIIWVENDLVKIERAEEDVVEENQMIIRNQVHVMMISQFDPYKYGH